MNLRFLIAAVLGLSGCATTPPASLVVSGETLFIRGQISEATAEEFERTVDQNPVSRVLIESGGGEVEPSIRIATEIRKRALDVEVIGDCFSSCANYIFPAGVNKTISGLGLVGWHGNMSHLLHMHAKGTKLVEAELLAEIQRLAKVENAFFNEIKVDPFVCWFAKIEPYNVRNLYFISADDMARFGITNVRVRADYAKTDVSRYRTEGLVELQFVSVDWEGLRRPDEAQ